MTLTRALLCGCVLSLLGGCGPASPPSEPADAPGEQSNALLLAPDVTLRPAVLRWAVRWSRASGRAIVVGDGDGPGVRVEMVAALVGDDGEERAGATSPERDHVLIHYRARDPEKAVGHELGHVLGGDHTETDGVLSGKKGARPVIDEAALLSVCRAGCGAFIPEE